jgi:hypothetical protein
MENIHLQASKQHDGLGGITGVFVKIRARWFWIAIHFFVVILGIFVAVN